MRSRLRASSYSYKWSDCIKHGNWKPSCTHTLPSIPPLLLPLPYILYEGKWTVLILTHVISPYYAVWTYLVLQNSAEGKIVTQQHHCPHAILVTNHTVLSSNLPSNLYKNTVNITTSELTHPLALCLQIQISTKTMQQKNISFFIFFFRMSNPCPLPPTHVSVPPLKGGGTVRWWS